MVDECESNDHPARVTSLCPRENRQPLNMRPWPAARPVSTLCADGPPVEYLWKGGIALRHSTLLVAEPKIGKTTTLSILIRSLQDGSDFLGRTTRESRTLIVSEESEPLWASRRNLFGLDDHLAVMLRPMRARPSAAQWPNFISHVAENAISHGANLVVFDTLAKFAPWRNENDAAEVIESMLPLDALMECGLALLFVQHASKADGGKGRAARGSNALTGAVDIVLELRRYRPSDLRDRRRKVASLGRFSDPEEYTIALSNCGLRYALCDQSADAGASSHCAFNNHLLASVLPTTPPGLTAEEVHKLLPKGRPRRGDVMEELRAGARSGTWLQNGTGKSNDAFRFWRQE